MTVLMKATDLRKVIDICETRNLRTSHVVEQLEAIAQHSPESARSSSMTYAANARAVASKYIPQCRAEIMKLKKILQDDEVANAWKGEDRYVVIGNTSEEGGGESQ